ncbi:hypothetical protein [Aureimonas mangrovi]|uniref:hypothetical protein n=1 Tax=Aureimonas mangrovi TaxID=2758041 RepID=UPI00163DD727|nr:hypothetical protein [Aureimonas mangrovi]
MVEIPSGVQAAPRRQRMNYGKVIDRVNKNGGGDKTLESVKKTWPPCAAIVRVRPVFGIKGETG